MANTPRHGRGARLYVNAINMSTMMTQAKHTETADMAETVVWQDSDKTYMTGVRDAVFTGSGLFSGSPNRVHEVLQNALGGSSDPIVTFYPEDDIIGRTAKLIRGPVQSFNVNSPVKDIVSIDVTVQSSTRTGTGASLHALSQVTTTAAYTAVTDPAATSFGGVGHLHVTQITSATTAVIKVQHSSNGAAWADLITFTNVNTTGVQRSRVTGTVKAQTRATVTAITGGKSVTHAVAFARYRNA